MEVDKESDQKPDSPTGWLRMRIWRLNLRMTKSAEITWVGSYNGLHGFVGKWGWWEGCIRMTEGLLWNALCNEAPCRLTILLPAWCVPWPRHVVSLTAWTIRIMARRMFWEQDLFLHFHSVYSVRNLFACRSSFPYQKTATKNLPLTGPRQANLCLRAFLHDKF